jgi:LmbE family N-acetylglucosaminyl deacetylase
VNVIAAVPSAENMPSGSATRPGDVLRHRGGKTSEVLNTDAEGRLILADALAYLAEQKPRVIVDTATLTGACMVALGEDIWGVMGNDRGLIRDLLAAGDDTGERGWELPLHEPYRKLIDSDVADIKNIGKRYGGAITAALFLREFVGETPWVHMDIAGPRSSTRSATSRRRGAPGYRCGRSCTTCSVRRRSPPEGDRAMTSQTSSGPVLAVFAHPDDAEICAGGTLARWASVGREVHLLVLTNGDRGSSDPWRDRAELAATRLGETLAAGEILGLSSAHVLEVHDGELENSTEIREQVIRRIRLVRAETVLSCDPTAWFFEDRYYNHSDHRRAGEIALDAAFPGAGNPHYFGEHIAEGLDVREVHDVWLGWTLEPNRHRGHHRALRNEDARPLDARESGRGGHPLLRGGTREGGGRGRSEDRRGARRVVPHPRSVLALARRGYGFVPTPISTSRKSFSGSEKRSANAVKVRSRNSSHPRPPSISRTNRPVAQVPSPSTYSSSVLGTGTGASRAQHWRSPASMSASSSASRWRNRSRRARPARSPARGSRADHRPNALRSHACGDRRCRPPRR